MRKCVARSLAAALVVVFLSGCSSSGGKKSFSWASMNPMNHFAKSNSKSPIPKPSDQMPPNVVLPNAAEVASTSDSSGGSAPLSSYGRTGQGDTAYSSTTGQVSSTGMTPQRGPYNLDGYTGGSLPPSQSSNDYSQYTPQTMAGSSYQASGSGYQVPPTSGYSSPSPAQYSLGGGNYDIQQNQSQGVAALPDYTSPTSPYANNAANTSPYQMPPLPSQSSGYDAGLAQAPYRNSTAPYTDAGVSPENPYSANASAYPAESNGVNSVASLPSLPSTANAYSYTRPPYDPGNTGYNPPNVPEYTPPQTGGYVQPATATVPNYAPGSVSRYSSVPSQTAPTGYGTTGMMY